MALLDKDKFIAKLSEIVTRYESGNRSVMALGRKLNSKQMIILGSEELARVVRMFERSGAIRNIEQGRIKAFNKFYRKGIDGAEELTPENKSDDDYAVFEIVSITKMTKYLHQLKTHPTLNPFSDKISDKFPVKPVKKIGAFVVNNDDTITYGQQYISLEYTLRDIFIHFLNNVGELVNFTDLRDINAGGIRHRTPQQISKCVSKLRRELIAHNLFIPFQIENLRNQGYRFRYSEIVNLR